MQRPDGQRGEQDSPPSFRRRMSRKMFAGL